MQKDLLISTQGSVDEKNADVAQPAVVVSAS